MFAINHDAGKLKMKMDDDKPAITDYHCRSNLGCRFKDYYGNRISGVLLTDLLLEQDVD